MSTSRGFTIIETMMYLTIASVIFIMSVTILSSRQKSNQFNQSVREFESTLNDISNNTANGVFPDIKDVVCTVAAGTITFSASAGTSSGFNNDCVFFGSVLQLRANSVGPSEYFLHTLVGKSTTNSSLASVGPIPLYKSSPNPFDATQTFNIPWGTSINKAYYTPEGGTPIQISGIGYIYSSYGAVTPTNQGKSGSADVSLYAITPVNPASPAVTLNNFRNSINFQVAKTPPENTLQRYAVVDGVVTVCLVGGDSTKRAMIELGGVNNGLSARTNYNVSTECTT